jgi:hypothetical protein
VASQAQAVCSSGHVTLVRRAGCSGGLQTNSSEGSNASQEQTVGSGDHVMMTQLVLAEYSAAVVGSRLTVRAATPAKRKQPAAAAM